MRFTAIITACVMAAPLSAQTLIGTWNCSTTDAATKTQTVEAFAKNGKYSTTFNINATTQGQEVVLVGTIKGKYELVGPLLTTEPDKIDLREAIVGGMNLMETAMKDQVLEGVRDALPSAKTSQNVTELTDQKMVVGSGDTATTCARVK